MDERVNSKGFAESWAFYSALALGRQRSRKKRAQGPRVPQFSFAEVLRRAPRDNTRCELRRKAEGGGEGR